MDVSMPLQAVKALVYLQSSGAPLSRVSLSSDSFGSLPEFDKRGRLVNYQVRNVCKIKWNMKKLGGKPREGKTLILVQTRILNGFLACFASSTPYITSIRIQPLRVIPGALT